MLTESRFKSEAYGIISLKVRPFKKMDDKPPLPPIVQKWAQNIQPTTAAILRWSHHLEQESAQ